MTTLQQLTDWWSLVEAKIEAAEGEVTPDIQADLDAYNFSEQQKVDGYIAVIKDLEAKAKATQSHIDELQKKQGTWLSRTRWLKDNAQRHMHATGATELHGQVWKFSIQKNGGQPPLQGLGIADPGLLPPRFQKMEIHPRSDELRLFIEHFGPVKEMSADGERILAEIGERGTHLRIR